MSLDFGSHTYCGFCRDLIPKWQSLTQRLVSQPFALISINADPDREKLKNALAKSGVTWTVVWDGDLGGPIFQAWDIQSWPTIFVIDKKGVISHKELTNGRVERQMTVPLHG